MLGGFSGFAQEHEILQYLPRRWQTVEGLPQNTILAIAQTRDGYMWVATRSGLDRFDGIRFTMVEAEELKGHAIAALCASKDGSLWIGMESEGLISVVLLPTPRGLVIAQKRDGRD